MKLKLEGAHASPGWVDLRAHFRDPGEEWKQGIRNGLDAAAAGGFTHVCALPSTTPCIDNSGAIGTMLRKAEGHPVRLMPLGRLDPRPQGRTARRTARPDGGRRRGLYR